MPESYLTRPLRRLLRGNLQVDPTTGGRYFAFGPIPKGTPVNLLANLQPLPETDDSLQRIVHAEKLVRLLVRLKHDLLVMPKNATDAQLLKVFSNLGRPLLELNKCPDFVVNRGHYFGTSFVAGEPGLSDEDKRALIEFIKTF